jgi:hypothetical protein
MARLAEIDTELAERQNEYEDAARDRARFTRDWEKRVAINQRLAKGGDAFARKQAALASAAEQDDLYDRLTLAEATYAAAQAAIRVRETRVSIGQSILKAQGRA